MTDPPTSAFAVLTPPGRGGIAVIRCVGPRAPDAVASCFRAARDDGLPPAGALAYGHVLDAGGAAIDEVIVHRAAEAALEVNCHGGAAAVRAVAERLAGLGLARVDPHRLLELEGMPRLERDARRALRDARAPWAARILLDQLGGALAGAVRMALADLEADRAPRAAQALDRLLGAWHGCGRLIAHPPRLAVAGRPNVGKSTLVNRLVGADRVITSDTPGTTRDYVEADAAIAGVPVVLVDTAGLREAAAEVERMGVERAHREAGRAELVLYLLDATEGVHEDDRTALERLGDRALPLWNKADLARAPLGPPAQATVSALTGEGLETLGQEVLGRLGFQAPAPGRAVPFTDDHAEALAAAHEALASGDAEAARRRLEGLLG